MNNLMTPATYEGSPIATSLQSGGRGYSHRRGCKCKNCYKCKKGCKCTSCKKRGGGDEYEYKNEGFADDEDEGYDNLDGSSGGTRRRRRKHSKKSRKGGKSRKTRRHSRKGRKH